jgi:hypothetical protein
MQRECRGVLGGDMNVAELFLKRIGGVRNRSAGIWQLVGTLEFPALIHWWAHKDSNLGPAD